jgi:ammonia channel protein AmtB
MKYGTGWVRPIMQCFMQLKVHTNILYLLYGYWLEYQAHVETNMYKIMQNYNH